MQHKTKRYLSVVAISVFAVGMTGSVLAQDGFGPGWGGNRGMMGTPGGMHRPGGMMGAPGRMQGPGGMMGTPGGMRRPGGMMGGNPAASIDQRLTELKTTLDITGDQETAWNAYADALRGRVGLMMSHRQLMLGATQITPEQRFAFRQQGMAQMQRIATASRDLYSTLTREQQARAGNLIGMHNAMMR